MSLPPGLGKPLAKARDWKQDRTWIGDPKISGHSAPTGPAVAAGVQGAAAFMCSRPMAGDDLSVGGAWLDRGPHPASPCAQDCSR